VLYDWTKYTKSGQERHGVDWKTFCQAIDRLTMYSLVESGVFTYFDLGVKPIYGGAIPSYIIKEHQQIVLFFQEARNEKQRMS
jgi:hypothetical protein